MVKIAYVIMFIMFLLTGCSGGSNETAAAEKGSDHKRSEGAKGVIVAVGDSLTAGYGLDEEQSYPFLLEQKLKGEGFNYTVINAGVTAETTSGTLARMEWILTLKPDIIILETGANDGLRGLDPNLAEANIRNILTLLQEEQVDVLLAGMKMVWNLGPEYVTRFNAIYPDLAEEFSVPLMPFFLEGVAMKDALNLPDALHPNEKGYRIIAEKILPHVIKVIKKRDGHE
jgi:acyl-CoA thioesterase-1